MIIKRHAGSAASKPAPAGQGLPKEVAAMFAGILEFLTVTEWSKGVPRTPGTLLLFCDGPQWKAWVNDKDADRSAFVSGPDVLSLLQSVEEGLREDRLDWRASKRSGGRRG